MEGLLCSGSESREEMPQLFIGQKLILKKVSRWQGVH